jgi:hypothetical protein
MTFCYQESREQGDQMSLWKNNRPKMWPNPFLVKTNT